MTWGFKSKTATLKGKGFSPNCKCEENHSVVFQWGFDDHASKDLVYLRSNKEIENISLSIQLPDRVYESKVIFGIFPNRPTILHTLYARKLWSILMSKGWERE